MPSEVKLKVLKHSRRPISISRLIALSFLGIILLGTLLLDLPISSRSGQSAGVMTSLFTATSATCVTGLILRDTYSQWSAFGQAVILLMIEIGGLGIMSAASMTVFFLRRRFGMRSQMLMAESIGASMGDVVEHQKKLLIRAFAVEGIGALILTLRFLAEYPLGKALSLGVFHSISAFCNAGFDILGFRKPGASLTIYQTDPVILLTLSLLIIIGGLGFLVWDDVLNFRIHRRWSVYTRLVVITTGILLLGGAALFCLLEWNNPATLGNMHPADKILAGFFQSVTLRTAGFAGVDQGFLTAAGKGLSIFLMLIGGSSGSTAGGLKTVTFVVLILFVWNRMRGRYTVSVFHRTISDDHVINAITLFIVMVSLSFFGAILISATAEVGFTDALYETVSAIGTVGLTTGITSRLHPVAKVMIIIFMYFGRVGILTLSIGFLKKKPAGEKFRFANTELLIG